MKQKLPIIRRSILVMLFADEALHGAAKGSATSFPQAIALGCSWNPEMVEEIFKATAEELRTRGTHLVLSPVVDLGDRALRVPLEVALGIGDLQLDDDWDRALVPRFQDEVQTAVARLLLG